MLTLKHDNSDPMAAPAIADTAVRAFSAVCDEGQRVLRLVLLDADDIGRVLAGDDDAEQFAAP